MGGEHGGECWKQLIPPLQPGTLSLYLFSLQSSRVSYGEAMIVRVFAFQHRRRAVFIDAANSNFRSAGGAPMSSCSRKAKHVAPTGLGFLGRRTYEHTAPPALPLATGYPTAIDSRRQIFGHEKISVFKNEYSYEYR